MKRTATASTSPKLLSSASPFSSSVTLFQLPDASASAGPSFSGPSVDPDSSESSPRRSKRVKLEVLEDEDRSLDSESPKVSRKRETSPKKREPRPMKLETPKKPKTIPKTESSLKSPRKPKPIQQLLATPHAAPERWRETYDQIKAMRARMNAPVDTMGCHQAQFREVEPKNRRYATLVSLMLSSQTKDEITHAAVAQLQNALGGVLSVQNMLAAEDQVISTAIGKVGFWRKKTTYLKQAAQILHDDFDSDVPKTVDELCSLPGVGPKMAFLALHSAWDINIGIGVDVHVHRITNRLGWHRPPTKTPEQTRLNLQSWLPTELHQDINLMLVGFGQMLCLPVGPRCDECTLSSNGLCPSAQKGSPSKKKSTVFIGPALEVSLDDS
ncbi:DNA glycosylase [Mycena floridula]|nr:DNA glycosylase [Mycena floridula]